MIKTVVRLIRKLVVTTVFRCHEPLCELEITMRIFALRGKTKKIKFPLLYKVFREGSWTEHLSQFFLSESDGKGKEEKSSLSNHSSFTQTNGWVY